MPVRASRSEPSSTACARLRQIWRAAVSASASERRFLPTCGRPSTSSGDGSSRAAMNDSTACESASMPEWAVTTGGAPTVSSGSQIACRGIRWRARDADLHLGAGSVIDGDRRRLRARARRGRQRDQRHDRPGHRLDRVVVSSGAPWASSSAVTFARSITLPPPTATITSGAGAAAAPAAASTAEAARRRGLGEDRDVEAGERLDDRGEARRAGDHRVGDHEHAARRARRRRARRPRPCRRRTAPGTARAGRRSRSSVGLQERR